MKTDQTQLGHHLLTRAQTHLRMESFVVPLGSVAPRFVEALTKIRFETNRAREAAAPQCGCQAIFCWIKKMRVRTQSSARLAKEHTNT